MFFFGLMGFMIMRGLFFLIFFFIVFIVILGFFFSQFVGLIIFCFSMKLVFLRILIKELYFIMSILERYFEKFWMYILFLQVFIFLRKCLSSLILLFFLLRFLFIYFVWRIEWLMVVFMFFQFFMLQQGIKLILMFLYLVFMYGCFVQVILYFLSVFFIFFLSFSFFFFIFLRGVLSGKVKKRLMLWFLVRQVFLVRELMKYGLILRLSFCVFFFVIFLSFFISFLMKVFFFFGWYDFLEDFSDYFFYFYVYI